MYHIYKYIYIYMHMSVHMNMHTYICISIYICIFLCLCKGYGGLRPPCQVVRDGAPPWRGLLPGMASVLEVYVMKLALGGPWGSRRIHMKSPKLPRGSRGVLGGIRDITGGSRCSGDPQGGRPSRN